MVERFFVVHDAAGLKTLVRRLLEAGVDEVGIKRADGPVVDALLKAELTVLVIAPGQLKNIRSRYGSAGNKNERFDAYVLAVVRTDRARLRPLVRDTPATAAMPHPAPALHPHRTRPLRHDSALPRLRTATLHPRQRSNPQVLFQYSRAAKVLWKLCNLGDTELAANIVRERPTIDWWERGAPRKR